MSRIEETTLRLVTIGLIALLTTLSAAAEDGIDAFERHDFAAARSALEQELAVDPDNARLNLYLGRTLLAQDDAPGAVAALNKAASITPDDPAIHACLGEAHGTLAANASIFRAGSHAKRSLAAFEQALQLDPDHERALEGLIVFKLSAPRLVGGSKTDALALSERLEKINAVGGAIRRARVLEAMDRQDEARGVLQQLAEEFVNDGRAHLRLGFMAQEEEDYASAMSHFRAAADATGVQPEQVAARHMAWYQMGRTAVFADDFQQAGIDALTRFIALDAVGADLPGKDWAHFRLGELLASTGRAERARENFEMALSLTDDDNLRRRARASL